jgi:NADH-quinone oxidoreductase subunit F
LNPKSISAFVKNGGFSALKKAQNSLTPEKVIAEVIDSGLLGRGGAGFSCGLKWKLAREQASDQKYVICNADEGEVGTFKDRYILQHDPFSLIEAIAIAAWAIGAGKAFIYLRAEYHSLSGLIHNAIRMAQAQGFLDHLDIELREGAGAYMCGEESGLMNSIEGLRGEARYKPPFPPQKGLWGKPTVINNVETLMNIPPIILKGSEWFRRMGTERSKGTKVFCVSGDVDAPGVYELEFGTPLSELVLKLAGARDVKMVQVGGACGRIIPGSKMDTPLAYESVLGSGAVVVFDRSRDVIDAMFRNAEFLADESCGRCAPCRDGCEAMLDILGRLMRGEGAREDLRALEDLSQVMTASAMCGLGQAASLPLMDTLKYFRGDYEARVEQSAYLRTLSFRA